jgi:CubicO group peptidase (beta-lactamase class C family)
VAGVHTRDDSRPIGVDALYDLASLTKPMVAALLARLARAGTLAWSTPLGALLAALAGTQSASCPLSLLASHRAGLVAHLRLGDAVQGPPADVWPWLVRCADARREECAGAPPAAGFAPVYSDLGYMLLGVAASHVAGVPLEVLLEREVCEPLQISELGSAQALERRFGDAYRRRVVATEVVAARGGELRGVVHDDNAWELVGRGLAGHAGAFGTARGVLTFAQAMLDALAGRREGWLTRREALELTRPRPGGSLLMGFDGKAATASSAGQAFGERAFGHLGFTGTSLWCDPDQDIAVVLLTNRVSPDRANIIIRSVRPDVHCALFGLAAGLRPEG